MPNACFVDTNILLYAIDPLAREKQNRARAWLNVLARHNLLVINPQVLNEYAYNVLRKMPRVGHEQLLADLESMRTWCVASVTADTAAQAVVITRRFRFSFYDAALLASAISHGCDTFLSEDMSHQQRVGELRIVDPFQSDFASVVGR